MLRVSETVNLKEQKGDVDLGKIITRLAQTIPTDATDVFVCIHTNEIPNVTGATITVNTDLFSYPISFHPVSDKMPAGSLWLGYGRGTLE